MSRLKPQKLRLQLYLIQFLLIILSYHVFLLIINYCFLITAVEQIFIPAAQFAILIKTTPKEEKAKIETHPETTRAKIS